jgi:predicted glycoside hydrolase/deacetylase ChbG (UPF0249 family)
VKRRAPKRKLRVTADDFGFVPGVTDGILEAHKIGIVTHTSLMAGGLDFERAVVLSRENPGLGVGIHLTLTWGNPLSPPASIPSLMGDGEKFAPLPLVLKRFLGGRLNKGEVAREWKNQIERVFRAGLFPTHLDSHHHLHLLPGLLAVAFQLAGEYRVPWLRRPRESFRHHFHLREALLKRIVLGMLTLRPWPLPTSDAFRGLTLQGQRDYLYRLKEILPSLPGGNTELMVHPGRADTLLEKEDTYVWEREIELQGLCDPGVKQLLKDLEIELDRPDSDFRKESL